MRQLPISLKNKLADRIKGDALGNTPHIRAVATCMSINTLLSEVIHEDTLAGYGDVTIRQTADELEPGMVYAACIDSGVVKIYKRRLPTYRTERWVMDHVHGAADDVAIEYNGIWRIHPVKDYCYLETDLYPYIFTLESGSLYVQHWTYADTRLQLATGVTGEISACRGWQNSLDPGDDQGLIIAYIKDGKIYYRALCDNGDGMLYWTAETEVTELDEGNVSVSVTRTNDYRILIAAEQDGQIQIVLSDRTYGGMGIKPETVHVSASAQFSVEPLAEINGYGNEAVTVGTLMAYFVSAEDDGPYVHVINSEVIPDTSDNKYNSGVRLYVDRALSGLDHLSTYISGCTVDVSGRTVANAAYDSSLQAIELTFDDPIAKTQDMTVTTPDHIWTTYDMPGGTWSLNALSAFFAGDTGEKYGYGHEIMSVSSTATFTLTQLTKHNGYGNEAVTVSSTAVFEKSQVGPTPV